MPPVFNALGFTWNPKLIPSSLPHYSIERVCFRFYRLLPEFVWDAGVLEGNPFTFPEVQTLLDGVTVGGHKISDQEQILNLAESSRFLLTSVKNKSFLVDKSVFSKINALVARNEALEWGHFRGEGEERSYTPPVSLGEHGRYTPIHTSPGAPELNRVFQEGIQTLEDFQPVERALAFFLFGSLQQFFSIEIRDRRDL